MHAFGKQIAHEAGIYRKRLSAETENFGCRMFGIIVWQWPVCDRVRKEPRYGKSDFR